jgi:tRNA threonylcarbamoyladenosine biosynthesis protein TsaE
MIKVTTNSAAQTQQLAQRLAERLRRGDVVALSGPLGAGKTTFVRGLATGLGIDERDVSSPTFILCQEYEPRDAAHGVPLAHLDGYRFASSDELATIGWDEMLERRDRVVVVEWAERFAEELPAERISIRLEHVDEHTRSIVIDAPRSLADRLEIPCNDSSKASVRVANQESCPVCGTTIAPECETIPFCSERCRLVDLGRWFNEGYRVSRAIEEADFDE